MEKFIYDIIVALLVISVGLNLWVAKKVYENQSKLKDEIDGTKKSLYEFKTEVIKHYLTKEEFNRFSTFILEQLKENNDVVIKRIDNLEEQLHKYIDSVHHEMLSKDQFNAEKKNFRTKDNGRNDG